MAKAKEFPAPSPVLHKEFEAKLKETKLGKDDFKRNQTKTVEAWVKAMGERGTNLTTNAEPVGSISDYFATLSQHLISLKLKQDKMEGDKAASDGFSSSSLDQAISTARGELNWKVARGKKEDNGEGTGNADTTTSKPATDIKALIRANGLMNGLVKDLGKNAEKTIEEFSTLFDLLGSGANVKALYKSLAGTSD